MRRFKVNTGFTLVLLSLCFGSFQNCSGNFNARVVTPDIASLSEIDGATGGTEVVENDPNDNNNETDETVLDGKALYTQNCSACHGAVSNSNKKDRTPYQISTAINTLSYMGHLQFLTADEIEKISKALGYDPNQPPGQCKGTRTADTTAVFRMNKGEYVNTVKDLFGSPSSVANNFPPDNDGEEFANNASLLAYVSTVQMEQYLYSAEKVVEDLWNRNKSLIMICDPTKTAPSTCAKNIIEAWGLRLFRRPLTTEERDELVAMVDTKSGVSTETFETGIQTALKALLFSPNFIYRTISSSTGVTRELDNYELATRLSYFLWNSTPDDELLSKAKAGALKQTSELKAQVIRMLEDPKSKRITETFAKRWMGMSRLAQQEPDTSVYPNYTPALKAAFEQETTLFFQNLFSQNLSLHDVLDADYSYLNGQLASHYGISGVSGNYYRKVSLADTPRRGVASQGSILTMTSHPDDSSVIVRGKWLLQNLMCDPPPPPPQNVPGLPTTAGSNLTKRQRLEAHRNSASCYSCHAKMEPLGFGFENFDAIGGWRTTLSGKPVDNAGALPNGQAFNSPIQLAQYLTDTHEFDQCAASKLVTYAIGRRLDDQDDCNVKKIAESMGPNKSIADTIVAIVTNDLFSKVRGK